jgi:hypothetical protein
MKKLLALLFIPSISLAAGSDFEITSGEVWTLYQGSRIVQPREAYENKWDCMEAAPLEVQYNCRGAITFIRREPVLPEPELPPVEPELPEEPAPVEWVKCAKEFTWCAFKGTKRVRYGVGTIWAYKDFTNGVQCENRNFFAGDPAPGREKACYLGGEAVPPVEPPPVEPEPEVPPPVEPPPPETCPEGTHGTPPNCMPHAGGPNDGTGYMPAVDVSKAMAPAQGFTTLRVRPTSQQPVGSPHDNGAFRIWCTPSHMNNDDAILYPGQQGRAHHHTYYGNTSANYASTTDSLLASNSTTCNGGIMNKSAYWLPSVIDTADGTPIAPRNVLLYYKHGPVTPFPNGLKVIAGDMHRTQAITGWGAYSHFECNEQYNSRQNHLVNCGQGGLLSMSVTFPDCWDGVNLSAPNQTHMRYSTNGQCLAGWKRVPTLTVIAYYRVTKPTGTSTWRLSSDNYPTTRAAGYSAHADFMMAWDSDWHKRLVENCINKARDCAAHLTGDGWEFF